jgi:ATP-dependent Lon protease
MADQSTTTLPVLPLTTGVVLPGMVVTIALETPEARAAADAAAGGELLLVPVIDGRYSSVGVVTKIEDHGDLPNGLTALVLRGEHRALIGSGVAGEGSALWVQANRAVETSRQTPRAAELSREYKAVVESILEARGAGRIAEILRGVNDPSAVADMAGYSPDLSVDQKVEILETLDVEARLARVISWARETLAEVTLKDRITSWCPSRCARPSSAS